MTPGALWSPMKDLTRAFGPFADDPVELAMVVRCSRYLQAESYRYAAESVRRRHPACSGFIVWMGHDCMHLTANNSLIQIDASTKPAYDWLQSAYANRHVSLRHDRFACAPGEHIAGEVWIHGDTINSHATGTVTASLRTLDGEIVASQSGSIRAERQSVCALLIDWAPPPMPERMFVIELIWTEDDETVMNRYLLSQEPTHPLAPLRHLLPATLSARADRGGRVRVRNAGNTVGVGVRLLSGSPEHAVLARGGNLILFPGESELIAFETLSQSDHITSPHLETECFNSEANFAVAT
jgi:beta-mannosidase